MWVPLKSRWHRPPGYPAADARGAEREEPAEQNVAEAVQARRATGEAAAGAEPDTGDAGAGK